MPVGLTFFDTPTSGGVARGEICMVLAYSSVGKTTFGLQVLRNNADKPAIFFSLEMSWRMVVSRLAAMESGVPTWEIEEQFRNGQIPTGVQAAIDKYRHLVCDDRADLTMREMQDSFDLAAQVIGQPPRIVLIDYLELIGGQGMLDKASSIDKLAYKLRNFARDNDTSVFLLHQVKMSDGDGSEELSLGSGKFGGHQPMDYVIGMYKPALKRKLSERERLLNEDQVWLQLLKNRNGRSNPTGQKHRMDPRSLLIAPHGMQQFTPSTPQPLVGVGATGMEDPF